MTTAQTAPRPGRAVLGPLSAAGVVGLLAAFSGGLAAGAPGALGGLLGGGLVCLVFTFGAVVLGVVARVAPAASLVVALLTYTLQVLLVGLVYVVLSSGGALDGPVDARWLSAAVIGCTVTWTVAQVVATVRERRPLYDVASQRPEASAG